MKYAAFTDKLHLQNFAVSEIITESNSTLLAITHMTFY